MSWQKCPICMGVGQVNFNQQCPTCRGARIIDEFSGKPPAQTIEMPDQMKFLRGHSKKDDPHP